MNTLNMVSGQIDPSLTDIDAASLLGDPQAPEILNDTLFLNEALPGLVRHEPTALLLDLNNFYLRSKYLGFSIDYQRIRNILAARCDLRYCGAFIAVDRTNTKTTGFVHKLERWGYDVFTKSISRYEDGDKIITKGNMDVELTVQAMRLSGAFGHIIIGSCDGDFIPLVDELKSGKFRKVSVLGISGDDTLEGMSRQLVKRVDHFYDICKLKDHVTFQGSRSAIHHNRSQRI